MPWQVQIVLGFFVRVATAGAAVVGISGATSCGSSERQEQQDAGSTAATIAELCDTIVTGYRQDPSCAGRPKTIARSTCVAASDVVNEETPEISCSELWRATLECAVRHDKYTCDRVSGEATLPGASACETEWREYARCVGRLRGGLVFDFPWHPCEAGSPIVTEDCPFVRLWAQRSHCYDSEQSACDCLCEYEGGVCSVTALVPACVE